MTSNQRNWAVFFTAFAATGLTSIAFFNVVGIDDESSRIALRLSARIAFVILLLVFVARPLHQLFVTPITSKLVRNRRLLGVAFAGIHTAHLGLIIHRTRTFDDVEFSLVANLPGVLTYVVIYLLFATSFDATAKMLGPRNWKMLHKVGLFWILAVFAQTQLPDSLDKLDDMNWLLVTMIAAALIVRTTAYLARRQRRSP